LTEDQKQAPQWSSVKNLKRQLAAIWLFIVAVTIIRLLTEYFLWAKHSFR